MTPLKRSALVLIGALALSGGVAAAAPDSGSPSPLSECETIAEKELGSHSGSEIAFVCAYFEAVPPEAWPPGAQEPVGGHPEIQIIR